MADTLSDATTPIMVDDNSETPSTTKLKAPHLPNSHNVKNYL
jgi:hypothetical protein